MCKAPVAGSTKRPIEGGEQHGQVLYTHGPGIDAPLSVVRLRYRQSQRMWSIIPHADWRGMYAAGTHPNGSAQRCQQGECLELSTAVDWPSASVGAFFNETRTHQPKAWWGSLIQNQEDASGQLYRRNRYYDPASGRFTQEDPIGLAGGLNLYGFGGGDPVSYSDPYGLCPECDAYWLNYATEGLRQGGVVGNAKALVGVAVSTALEFFGINDLWRARDQAANGQYRQAAVTGGLAVIGNVPGGKVGRAANLVDGMRMKVDDALGAAVDFLGAGYKEVELGRFVSDDGLRQVRMLDVDIANAKPHMNFETLKPKPGRPGVNTIDENYHVYLEGR